VHFNQLQSRVTERFEASGLTVAWSRSLKRLLPRPEHRHDYATHTTREARDVRLRGVFYDWLNLSIRFSILPVGSESGVPNRRGTAHSNYFDYLLPSTYRTFTTTLQPFNIIAMVTSSPVGSGASPGLRKLVQNKRQSTGSYGCVREVYHPLDPRAEPSALFYYDSSSDEESEGELSERPTKRRLSFNTGISWNIFFALVEC